MAVHSKNLGDTEVMLDEWPWLAPYIEVEAPSEARVREVSAALGLDWALAKFGDVMVAYREQYPHLGERGTVVNLAFVRFSDPLPDIFRP